MLVGQRVMHGERGRAGLEGAEAKAGAFLKSDAVLAKQPHVGGHDESLGGLARPDALELVEAGAAGLIEANVTQRNPLR
jgi:hypothetical protein